VATPAERALENSAALRETRRHEQNRRSVRRYRPRREVMMMASQSAQPATNERIVRLLEEVKAQLAESIKQQKQIARDLGRLLSRK
jgi:hypothetical protein